jgi:hypothetical protein
VVTAEGPALPDLALMSDAELVLYIDRAYGEYQCALAEQTRRLIQAHRERVAADRPVP